MKQISHLYDQLTAKERFTVAVEALARGDMDEIDRLNDTCPRKRYEIGDLAYHTRLNELWRMALLVKTELLKLRQNMAATLAVIVTLESAEDDDADSFETAVAAYGRMCAVLKGKQAAWAEFCQGLGLTGDDVFRAFRLNDLDDDMAAIVLSLDPPCEIVPSNDAHDLMIQTLRDCWSRVEGKLQ